MTPDFAAVPALSSFSQPTSAPVFSFASGFATKISTLSAPVSGPSVSLNTGASVFGPSSGLVQAHSANMSQFGMSSFGTSTPESIPPLQQSSISQSVARPAFGFGASLTAPTFGVSAAPAFGMSTAPAFGTSAAPVFAVSAAPAFATSAAPAFGTSATPAFGTSAAPVFAVSAAPAFATSAAPPFATSAMPAFGTSAAPAFGMSAVPVFNVQQPQSLFGQAAAAAPDKQATVQPGSFSFAATSSGPLVFGAQHPAVPTTAPLFGLGKRTNFDGFGGDGNKRQATGLCC